MGQEGTKALLEETRECGCGKKPPKAMPPWRSMGTTNTTQAGINPSLCVLVPSNLMPQPEDNGDWMMGPLPTRAKSQAKQHEE